MKKPFVMKKTLAIALAFLTASTAAWAISTQITYNDIMISTGHDSVELNPNASVDKGARSYLGGYSTITGAPYITGVNSGTGLTYWSNALTDVQGDFRQLALIGGTVCAGGAANDDNGDGGDNVVKLSGSKNLLVWVYDTDSSDTIVLSINPKTGVIAQQD
jgi:hypothetical protein